MIDKLPKSKVLKQSDPDTPGLRLHPRYPSTNPLTESAGFRQSFCTRATRRAPFRPGGPPGPQNLTTLLIGLRWLLHYRSGAMQEESPKWDVCLLQLGVCGVFIGAIGRFPRGGRSDDHHVGQLAAFLLCTA
jgi:hypothetical protein